MTPLEVQEKSKLIYDERNHNSNCLCRVLTGKKHKGFSRVMTYSISCLSVGYKTGYICQNSLHCELKIVSVF